MQRCGCRFFHEFLKSGMEFNTRYIEEKLHFLGMVIMAEEGSRLAKAIVGLFKEFYIGYLSADLDLHKNDMDSICNHYNNIARLLNGRDYTNSEGKAIAIEIDDERICDFQTELDKLSSVERKLFLRNLLDFIKAYKLYALKDILKYIEDIAGDFEHIAEKINNAEKYLADLIIAVGKGEDSKDLVTKLEELKSDYVKGTFFKNEKGLNLIVKTVKELGITKAYGEVMKKNFDIGKYYKRMSFDNPDLICENFKNWDALKQFVDKNGFDKLKSTEGINQNDFEQLKTLYYMERPHAHHALYKNWHEMVEEAQDILWEYDIDPFVGLENLCWAPNIKGQHSTDNVKEIIDGLKELKKERATRNDIVSFLLEQKKISSEYVKK